MTAKEPAETVTVYAHETSTHAIRGEVREVVRTRNVEHMLGNGVLELVDEPSAHVESEPEQPDSAPDPAADQETDGA